MTANAKTGKLLTGKRPWVLVLAFFGVVLVVMAIVWLVRKSKQSSQTGADGSSSGTQFPPYNPSSSTSTPPYVPTNNPNNPNNGNGGVNPNDVYNVNWAYVQQMAWKMHDTYFDRGSYKCEITNGIIEMGANDLRALNDTYLKWYNRNLKTDYCQKIQSSGCWTAFWDDKPAKACNRLNNLN